MTDATEILRWLERWCASQCDGEWEHRRGVRIESLDNPGWLVDVDLEKLGARAAVDRVLVVLGDPPRAENGNLGGDTWLTCEARGGRFVGAGDPSQLGNILEELRRFVTTPDPLPSAPPPSIRRGDLYWLALDSSDRSESDGASYAHPHVVVQEDVFNASRISTVIVCALTSNLQRASEPGNVLLDVGEGDLPKQSVVVVSQIASVDKARLGARIGALSEGRIEQILAGLRFQQRSFFER